MSRKFGNYEVLELIERVGGTSTYKARQTTLDRLVMLTILPPQQAEKAAFKQRFGRQFAAASKLSHPNVAGAVDAGTVDGHLYIAAEYTGGMRLADALAAREWFPLRRSVAIALDVAHALTHLEEHRILHRNVSPQTILLAESGLAKLRGFSLSKEDVGSASETWFDLDAYAAQYTSPEMINPASPVDARSDISSLGCVLYHILTGRPPFPGTYAPEVLKKQQTVPVPAAQTYREDLPAPLASVLDRCLEKKAADRYPSARALADDLEALKERRPQSAEPDPAVSRPLGRLRSFLRRSK